MDPISIISLAASTANATYQVSSQIYDFINAVKNVDDTVKALSSEMSSLRRSLDAIGTVLANPLVKTDRAMAPENAPIWAATAGALEDCRKSLLDIQKKIAPYEKEKARHTLFRRAVTTWKLNASKEEIGNLRSQTQTHTHSLQLSLQMINLLIAGIGPANAVEDIGQEMANLTSSLKDLEMSKGDGLSENAARVEAAARDMLRKAPEFVTTGLFETDDEESRTSSIQALRRVVTDYNKSLFTSSESSSLSGKELDSSTATSPTLAEDSDSDSDEDIEQALTQELFAKADERYQSQKYKEAEDYFRDGLRHYAGLSRTDKSVDVNVVRMKLAVCCFHEEKHEEAELMLLVLGKGQGSLTVLTMQAYHYLAQIYLCLYNFEPALEYASMAAAGRRKLLGKKDTAYLSSVQLQSLVYEANGDFVTAKAYGRKVPADFADRGENSVAISRFSGYSDKECVRLSLKEKETALVELSGADIFKNTRREPRIVTRDGQQHKIYLEPGKDSLNMEKALRWAGMHGKLLAAKWLMARGASPNGDSDNSDALLEAAYAGQEALVRLLCEAGARLESRDNSGHTPLYWASLWGHESSARALLDAGADINGTTNDGETPLMGAACKGHISTVEMLLARGADVMPRTSRSQKNALMEALCNGHVGCAQVLLAHKSDVHVDDWNAGSPLLEAVGLKHMQLVTAILDAGVDAAPSHNAPLLNALRGRALDIAQLLVDRGADVNVPSPRGTTALYEACDGAPNPDILRFLLKHGADPNARPKPDRLYAAAMLKHRMEEKRVIAVTKEFPFKDCRDDGKECKQCARYD